MNRQSSDIVVKPYKRKLIDWATLKAEFIMQDEYPLVQTWLRETQHFTDRQLKAGNTFSHTTNWGKERAEYKQKILAKRMQATQEAIQFVMPDVMEAKLVTILYYINELKTNKSLALRDRSHIFNKLKTELGEPIVITKNKNEDTITYNSVEILLEAYGIKADGSLAIDDSLRPNTSTQG